jgi:hypothetical protein
MVRPAIGAQHRLMMVLPHRERPPLARMLPRVTGWGSGVVYPCRRGYCDGGVGKLPGSGAASLTAKLVPRRHAERLLWRPRW